MSISIEFETIIVCRPIIDLRFKGGWEAWLKKFSIEDDGHLSRISAMSGHDIARTEKKIQKLGLLPPEVTQDCYQYRDYYLYAMEYKPHKLHGFDNGSSPNWLIWNEPSMAKITASELNRMVEERTIKTNPFKPTLDFNHEAQIT
jgi:hypothetical protein